MLEFSNHLVPLSLDDTSMVSLGSSTGSKLYSGYLTFNWMGFSNYLYIASENQ